MHETKSKAFRICERVYEFPYVPQGVFAQLMVRLLAMTRFHSDYFELRYSRTTIFMKILNKGGSYMRSSVSRENISKSEQKDGAESVEWALIELSHTASQITIFVVEERDTKTPRLLRMLVESMDNLLEDWFSVEKPKTFVSCNHCLSNASIYVPKKIRKAADKSTM